MFKRISLQIAGIALLATIIISFIFSDHILEAIFRHQLSREIVKLNETNGGRKEPRTRLEIDNELSQLGLMLTSGDSERNTDILTEELGKNLNVQTLRLALDLTYQKDFISHVHPREEIFEFVANSLISKPTLERELIDRGDQVGISILREFLKMARSQH